MIPVTPHKNLSQRDSHRALLNTRNHTNGPAELEPSGFSKTRLLIDCDNTLGLPFADVDDGLALLLALGWPNAIVKGVTLTYGNAALEKVVRQTSRLMREVDSGPLGNSPGSPPVCMSGARGPGDWNTDAAAFLAEEAALSPGQITLVALGPLTNIAGAALLDPSFFRNLRRIVVMGGHRQPLRLGLKRVREINFSADPSATSTVMSAPCPIDIVDADLCMQASIDRRDISAMTGSTGIPPWIETALMRWLYLWRLCGAGNRFVPWDVVAMLAALSPELFLGHPVAVQDTNDVGRAGYGPATANSKTRLLTVLREPDQVPELLKYSLARLSRGKIKNSNPVTCVLRVYFCGVLCSGCHEQPKKMTYGTA